MKIFHRSYTGLIFQLPGLCSSTPIFKPAAAMEMRQWAPRSEPQRTRKLGSGLSTPTREALEETGQLGNWDRRTRFAAIVDGVAASELQ